jgi:hypothetical protein
MGIRSKPHGRQSLPVGIPRQSLGTRKETGVGQAFQPAIALACPTIPCMFGDQQKPRL